MVPLKSAAEIALIRECGVILAQALQAAAALIRPGVATRELDDAIRVCVEAAGAVCGFKGYHGFPGHCCVSVDAEVVHGIPGDRVLTEGQVVSVDVGVKKEGYYGDGAETFPVGTISADKLRLLEVTRASLYAGIAQARAGNRLYDISQAIEDTARSARMGIVRDLVGHGIGRALHEEPQVPNYVPSDHSRGMRLQRGMVLAIEPMVSLGSEDIRTLDDRWTVVTADGSTAAHFEHTIAITDGDPVILTNGA